MSTNQKALVSSGGGTAGGAWMLGIIDALHSADVDLGDADLIVGTSAGARVGAVLATGALDHALGLYRRSDHPRLETRVPLDAFVAAAMRIMSEFPDRQEAAKRIANLEPLGSTLVTAEDRQCMVAAQLPVQTWPEKRVAITAVDTQSGLRVVFDANSGVALLDAASASGALPGIFPLVTIDGKRYADSPAGVRIAELSWFLGPD